MTQTIIEESKWYRGKGSKESMLLRQDGTMCCLGFDALRRGFSEKEILGVGSPSRLSGSVDNPKLRGLTEEDPVFIMAKANTDIVSEIIQVNDDDRITDEQRKSKLTELFQRLDTEVVFVP